MSPATTGGWLTLGLLTGAGCLLGCGPVLLPFLLSCGESSRRLSLQRLGQFLLGRCVAYFLLGLPVLLLGQQVQLGPGWSRLTGLATIVLALLLLSHACGGTSEQTCGLCHRAARKVPFAVGLALGLTPCAPLLLVLGTLLTAGGWLSGLAFLVGFVVSSAIWLPVVLLAGSLARRERWQGVAQVLVVLGGLWFLARGWTLLVYPLVRT